MIIWMTIILVTLFFSLLFLKTVKYSSNGQKTIKYSIDKYAYIFIFLVLAIFAGLRSGIGDSGFYMYSFEQYKSMTIPSLLNSKEPGFKLIIILLSKIYDNPQILLMFCSIITIGLIFISMYKYSDNLFISLFLFIASGSYFSTMNGIRQYLVVSVIFFMTDFILKNKTVFYLIAIILLSSIHTSVLIMIPAYFFANSKTWTSKKIFFLIVMSLLLITNGSFTSIVADLVDNGQYSIYSESLNNSVAEGANIFRVLVMFVPIIFSFLGRKYFANNDKRYRVFSNMAILNFLFYLLSYQNWIFARVAMYFQLYTIVLYPYVIGRIFNLKDQKIVYMTMICFYLCFYTFEVKNTTYTSYYLNINREQIGELTKTFY